MRSSSFSTFLFKESQVPTVVNVGGFIERPVTEAKSKSHVRSYEWMPDKDHAELHREDKKTAKVKVLATTHRLGNDVDRKPSRGYLANKKKKSTKKHHHHRRVTKEKDTAELTNNEVFVNEEEMREIKRKMKAQAEAKEYGRKKEMRKKGEFSNPRY